MIDAARTLERFRLALNVAAVAAVLYGVYGLFTHALGGFVLPALVGGALLSLVLIPWNRQHAVRAAMPDPFARDAFSTDSINFAHVRVAGVGGAGLLVVAVIVAFQYELTAGALSAGLIGGALLGTALIAHRRRR